MERTPLFYRHYLIERITTYQHHQSTLRSLVGDIEGARDLLSLSKEEEEAFDNLFINIDVALGLYDEAIPMQEQLLLAADLTNLCLLLSGSVSQ